MLIMGFVAFILFFVISFLVSNLAGPYIAEFLVLGICLDLFKKLRSRISAVYIIYVMYGYADRILDLHRRVCNAGLYGV